MCESSINILQLEGRLRSIVSELGWSYENLEKEKNAVSLVHCPLDPSHRMPEEHLEEHKIRCSWRRAGYSSDDIPLSENATCSSSLLLTSELQEKILRDAAAEDPSLALGGDFRRDVPQTANRLQQSFTQDERRAIYDYVVSRTKRETPAVIVSKEPVKEDEKKELTALELAVAERDAKRRRATYRNKIHTNRKSHIEVLRDVIETQMNHINETVEEHSDTETSRRNSEDKLHKVEQSSVHHRQHSERSSGTDKRHHERASTSFYYHSNDPKRSNRYDNADREKYQSYDSGDRSMYKEKYDSHYNKDYDSQEFNWSTDVSRRDREKQNSSHSVKKHKRKRDDGESEKKHKHKKEKKKKKKKKKLKRKSRSNSSSSSTS